MIKEFELTQSSLKDFINLDREQWKNKWILKNRPFEYNTSFIYGSLLDGFLFDQESLKRNFASYKGSCRPSDALQAVVGLMSKTYDKNKSIDEQLLVAARKLNFGNKWKDLTVVNRFTELYDYIQFCIDNKYKTVVLKSYAKEIQDVANHLVNHQPNEIYKYIVKEPSEDYKNEFQRTLRGTIYGLPCKIILDILHYDEVNSTIRDVDFKTTYDASNFTESINKYGYDTQVSFYQEILKQNQDLFKNYTLLAPMNIVVGKRDMNILVHHYNELELEVCKHNWMKVVKEISEYLQKLKHEKK